VRNSRGIAVIALVSGVVLAAPATAQEASPPEVSVRAYGGLASGAGAEVWAHARLRTDLDAATFFGQFDLASAALVVPLAGTRRTFVGVRAGYELEYEAEDGAGWRGSRLSQAVDGSLVGRLESVRGHAIEAQVGVEGVFRAAPAGGSDDALLPTESIGLRVALTGEVALWRELALFAHAELRTGAHVTEIRWLPLAALGLRYRF